MRSAVAVTHGAAGPEIALAIECERQAAEVLAIAAPLLGRERRPALAVECVDAALARGNPESAAGIAEDPAVAGMHPGGADQDWEQRRGCLARAHAEHEQLAGKPRGMLRVTAPTYFGATTLAPQIRDFRSRYPEIALDLDLSDRIEDLVKERFDVAVRISALHDSSLVAMRLAPCPTALVGSPA